MKLKLLILSLTMILTSNMMFGKTKVIKGVQFDREYQNTYIEANSFEGVIFSKDYMCICGNSNRFTPSVEDIELTENLLNQDIQKINTSRYNQGGHNPKIDKKLCKYVRQYFGYTDDKGDKIIFINCFWGKGKIGKIHQNWKLELIQVCDGGSYYWSIKVNLTKRILFDLQVNGVA